MQPNPTTYPRAKKIVSQVKKSLLRQLQINPNMAIKNAFDIFPSHKNEL
jgi:hypothetical protein